jgi:hypothetical protein
VAVGLLQQRHNVITHSSCLGRGGPGTLFKPFQTNRSQESANRRKSTKAQRQHDGEIMDGQIAGVCQEAEESKGSTAVL